MQHNRVCKSVRLYWGHSTETIAILQEWTHFAAAILALEAACAASITSALDSPIATLLWDLSPDTGGWGPAPGPRGRAAAAMLTSKPVGKERCLLRGLAAGVSSRLVFPFRKRTWPALPWLLLVPLSALIRPVRPHEPVQQCHVALPAWS